MFHSQFLFNPNNPNDITKYSSTERVDGSNKLVRIQPMRETSTVDIVKEKAIAKSIKRKVTNLEIYGSEAIQDSEGWGEKWDQMICQIVSNFSTLATLNPRLVIHKGCTWKSTNGWKISTDSAADLHIINARTSYKDWKEIYPPGRGEEIYMDPGNKIFCNFKGKLVLLGNNPEKDDAGKIILPSWKDIDEKDRKEVLMTTSSAQDDSGVPRRLNVGTKKEKVNIERTNLEHIHTINKADGYPLYYAFVSRIGMLGKAGRRANEFSIKGERYDIHIIKVVVPGHYTLAILYPYENRVEFFDSGGSIDSVGFYDDNTPYSASIERKKTLKQYDSKLPCINENSLDNAVCQTFQSIFQDCEYVGINTINLQLDDRDAYCQTWVWLYVYLKFIYPCYSTRELLEFLYSKRDKVSAYNLVLGWWNYIIYLDTSFILNPEFLTSYYNSLQESSKEEGTVSMSKEHSTKAYGGNNKIVYKSSKEFYRWLGTHY